MNPATVVVTGLGAISPVGLGLDAHWTATLRGESGIRPIARFDPAGYPVSLAGEVHGFDPAGHLTGRMLAQTDHMTQLALVASDWTLADAGVRPEESPEYEIGVMTASSAGGFEFGQRELENQWGKGPQYVSAYMSFAWFYAVNTGQISIRHSLRGPSGVVVTEQAGGLDAVAQARRMVRKGGHMIIAGGVDGAICPWGVVAQLPTDRLSSSDDPDRAYLPFDSGAAGHVPGEGGALMLLEDAAAARRRGARVYGEIAGYGTSFDPRPGSGRPSGLGRAVRTALDDAAIGPEQIGVVFADAAAVPDLDETEADVLRSVFGPRGVPVTAPKTMTGRLAAGGASLDLAGAFLALRDGLIPPTVNVSPDPSHDLDLVMDQPRPMSSRAALVVSRGLGGFNSAMVVRGAENPTRRNKR